MLNTKVIKGTINGKKNMEGNLNYGTKSETDHRKLNNLDFENSGHTGFQKEITPGNELSSDLVNDTNSNNKFVTSKEKENWNKTNFMFEKLYVF